MNMYVLAEISMYVCMRSYEGEKSKEYVRRPIKFWLQYDELFYGLHNLNSSIQTPHKCDIIKASATYSIFMLRQMQPLATLIESKCGKTVNSG